MRYAVHYRGKVFGFGETPSDAWSNASYHFGDVKGKASPCSVGVLACQGKAKLVEIGGCLVTLDEAMEALGLVKLSASTALMPDIVKAHPWKEKLQWTTEQRMIESLTAELIKTKSFRLEWEGTTLHGFVVVAKGKK